MRDSKAGSLLTEQLAGSITEAGSDLANIAGNKVSRRAGIVSGDVHQ